MSALIFFSFNHQTKPYQYASTASLLRELIVTISKGGNFLLNVGPDASGLLHNVMVNTLLDMGRWIDKVHEAIFDSVPYWVAVSDFNEAGQPLYFMQSKDGKSIYVFSFERPQARGLVIRANLPLHSESKISLLTKKKTIEEYLDWDVYSNGRLIVDVPDRVLDMEKMIWVFKIEAP
jgi:alpha-L-fucosidase